MSRSSRKGKQFAIESFDRFSREEFRMESCEKMIEELKGEDENILYDVLQKWIKWEP